MVVGFISCSPSDIAGSSTGKPPASSTPRLMSSTRSGKWVWQVLRSFQVLTMPMIGRPANSSFA